MGKGTKSQSSSSSTTNTKNLSLQGVQGTQVFSDGEVNVVDGGAIEGSLEIGRDAVEAVTLISQAFLDANQKANERAIGLTETVASGLDSYAGRVTDLAQSAATDDTAETIQTLVKWTSGAVAIYFISKNIKS